MEFEELVRKLKALGGGAIDYYKLPQHLIEASKDEPDIFQQAFSPAVDKLADSKFFKGVAISLKYLHLTTEQRDIISALQDEPEALQRYLRSIGEEE